MAEPVDDAQLRHIQVYDAILLGVTCVDIVAQLYVLVVIAAATPDRMKQYRFWLLLYTVLARKRVFVSIPLGM